MREPGSSLDAHPPQDAKEVRVRISSRFMIILGGIEVLFITEIVTCESALGETILHSFFLLV